MDAGIDSTSGDLTGKRIKTLANAIYLRLTVPLGSWWADPTVGSRLYLLRRSKDLSRVGKLAKQYAAEALQPLVDDGRANSVSVDVEQPHNGWLLLLVTVTDSAGVEHVFQHPVRVI
ncbi:phage GP46 family protein [Pseudomonas sp. NPDC090201]|uniref:phage GP46 family protein n=1 Tax=Pseudomonas sp. NPDC090201 TaxID=3364475 RepID=UPI0037F31E42